MFDKNNKGRVKLLRYTDKIEIIANTQGQS